MTQDEMNALMTERFELEAAGEIDWQARAERAEAQLEERDPDMAIDEMRQTRWRVGIASLENRERMALTRAERAEVDLRELRENVLLALGMTAEDVAAIDDDLIDSTISYLLSGYAELVARVAELQAQLAARPAAIEHG